MKLLENNNRKLKYNTPEINQIRLDTEISLALESSPPMPGNENISYAPEYFNNDPFNNRNV